MVNTETLHILKHAANSATVWLGGGLQEFKDTNTADLLQTDEMMTESAESRGRVLII